MSVPFPMPLRPDKIPTLIDDRAEIRLIEDKRRTLRGVLGKAVSSVDYTKSRSFFFQNFEHGCIIGTKVDAAHIFEIHGAIYGKWNEMGREGYGLPITDELTTPDGVGKFNHFNNNTASIYWHPDTGAHAIYGAIRKFWSEIGWERSSLGYPISDEMTAPDSIGRINYFQREAIYCSSRGTIIVNDVKTFEAMIVFSDGTALGGYAKVVVNKNGDCTFSGHLHDSGFDPYSFTVMGVIMTPSGIGYTLVYSGHTEGTSSNFFGSPNRDNDWFVGVNKPEIRDNWVQINMAVCEFKTTAQDNFASNVQDTLNDIAKDAVKAFAAAGVKGLIALI
ncbi:MAG: hypothetical protein ABI691_05800 [Ginsengibacter sp.]